MIENVVGAFLEMLKLGPKRIQALRGPVAAPRFDTPPDIIGVNGPMATPIDAPIAVAVAA